MDEVVRGWRTYPKSHSWELARSLEDWNLNPGFSDRKSMFSPFYQGFLVLTVCLCQHPSRPTYSRLVGILEPSKDREGWAVSISQKCGAIGAVSSGQNLADVPHSPPCLLKLESAAEQSHKDSPRRCGVTRNKHRQGTFEPKRTETWQPGHARTRQLMAHKSCNFYCEHSVTWLK